jgi:hypothetical protein
MWTGLSEYTDCLNDLKAAKTTFEIRSILNGMLYGRLFGQEPKKEGKDSIPYKDRLNTHKKKTRERYELRQHKYGYEFNGINNRYTGLNIQSWYHRATIEWRMKEGTIDPTELMYWPLFCGWFTHLATKLSDQTMDAVGTLDELVSKYMPVKLLEHWYLPKQQEIKQRPKITAIVEETRWDPYAPPSIPTSEYVRDRNEPDERDYSCPECREYECECRAVNEDDNEPDVLTYQDENLTTEDREDDDFNAPQPR